MKICFNVNYSKPIFTGGIKSAPKVISGGLNLLTAPMVDKYCFSNVDKSLTPKFLNSLLNIKESNYLKRVTKIKDKILPVMGFKHPEALKISYYDSDRGAESFDLTTGQIYMSKNRQYDNKSSIMILRHELEHMKQFVKIYKAVGEDAFLEGALCITKRIDPEITISDIRNSFNKDFYEIMSKDVSLEGFDADKYYKAMCDYCYCNNNLSAAYKYFNNILEKDAYDISRKVLRAIGEDPVVSADQFPTNYKTMLRLLNDKNIPISKQDSILTELNTIARLKAIETPENFEKFLKIWIDKRAHMPISYKDEAWFSIICDKMQKDALKGLSLQVVKSDQKCYKQVENWIREDKFTVNDVYKGI